MPALIISATDRADSFSLKVSLEVQKIYLQLGERFEVLPLRSIDFQKALQGPYEGKRPAALMPHLKNVARAPALVIVCPEYNGSFPGIFKYFVDHWLYPGSFKKPICLIGLGGRFGGLRAVEHLTGVFSYRESLLFPEKALIQNVKQAFEEGREKDFLPRLKKQAQGFLKFVRAFS